MRATYNGTTPVTPSDNSVTSSKIADGTIAAADLAAQSVTLAKVSRTGGTSGQVLTHQGAGADPVWSTPSGGGASLPTTIAGLIADPSNPNALATTNGAGSGVALPVATAAPVLVGVVASTAGSIPVGSGSGSATGLAIGTTGKVLTVVAGAPAWALPSAAVTAASDGAAMRTALSLGSLATASSVTASQVSDATATGSALLTAASASSARSTLGLGTLATASSVASTSISDSTTVGRALVTGTDAAACRSTLGLGSLATASTVASTSISDSTTVGRSVLTAADAAAARSAISAGTSSYADPLTTNGDTVVRAGGATTRLAVGAEGRALGVVSGAPAYALPSALVTAASDGAAMLTAVGGVPTSRTIAGAALSADISAATLRSGLSLPASASAPSTTPILQLSADSGVTDDGTGRCSTWVGTGSVGATFTAPTSGRRPAIVQQALNGRKALLFSNGRTDTLTTSYSASLDPASALTVIVVATVKSSGAAVVIARPYTTTHTSPFCEWWVYANVNNIDTRVASSTLSISVADDNNLSAWRRSVPCIITYRLATSARKVRVSGYDVTTAAAGATVAYTNNVGLRIGSNASDGEAATMWLYQIRLFSGSLTDAQVSEHEADLAAYYGLPLNFL